MTSPTTVPEPTVKPDQRATPPSLAMSIASHANVNIWIDCERANVIVFPHRRAKDLCRNTAKVAGERPRPPPLDTSTCPAWGLEADATWRRCYRSPGLPTLRRSTRWLRGLTSGGGARRLRYRVGSRAHAPQRRLRGDHPEAEKDQHAHHSTHDRVRGVRLD